MGGRGTFSGAISDTKFTIKRLDRQISDLKRAADEIVSGKRSLPSFYERDTPETRKDYSQVFLKSEGYRKLVAQRTQAQNTLERIERIRKTRKS